MSGSKKANSEVNVDRTARGAADKDLLAAESIRISAGEVVIPVAHFEAIQRQVQDHRRREEELLTQVDALNRKNASLLEILGLIEIDKKKISRNDIESDLEAPVTNTQDRKSRQIIKDNMRDVTAIFTPQGVRPPHRLSPREMEIANLVKNGQSNKDIAGALSISVKTVETIRNKIRRKLGLVNKSVNLISYFRNT